MYELKERLQKLARPFSSNHTPSLEIKDQSILKKTIDQAMAYIEFDSNGCVIQANDNFLDLMGYQQEEVIGRHHSMFCEERYTASADYKVFWENLLSGQPNSGEFQRVSNYGDYVWLNASYTPVLDHEGRVERVIKIASDVTEMVKSRHQASWVKTAVDTGWASIEFSVEGTVLGANQNFLDLFGYLEEEILGKHHRIFCEPQYVESPDYAKLWEGFSNGEIAGGEFKRLTKAGGEVYIYATYTPVRNSAGDVEKVIKIASDVTRAALDRQRLAEFLDQINELSETMTDSSEEMSGRASAMSLSTIEMSSAIEQMTGGAQDQSVQLEEISGFLEGLLHAAEDSARKASEISAAAQAGVSEAMNGKSKLASLATGIQGISSNSEVVEGSIKELVRKSSKITSALSVITEISARTNLLSLNASIQAARAGSAGKAFSVVAEEIRSLAEESKDHVKSIDEVIVEIQQEIHKAEQAIGEMNASVAHGVETSKEADMAFETLETSTTNTLNQAEEIETYSEVQTQSITKIVEAVERVVVVAEQTAAGTEELASSSVNIKEAMLEVEQTSQRLQALTEELQIKVNQR